MDCQYRQATDTLVHCQLVDIGVPAKSDPCGSCKAEWTAGPPTDNALTPTLQALVSRFNGKPIAREPRRLLSSRPKRERKPPPPLIVRMKSFATAFAQWLASGGKVLSVAESQARLAICAECPERTKYFLADACGICGCHLGTKAKWPQQKCPLRKWPGDDKATPCGKCGKS